MSNNQILKLRRSAVPGKVPSTSSLAFGELALNTHDGYVFIKKSGSNGEEIVVVGAGSSGSFSGSFFGTSSWARNSLTASFAPLYLPLVGGTIDGNLTVNGTASIAYLNVLYETASVIYSSGSNQFGDAADDIQTLFGSVIIPTGSLVVSGSIRATSGISGSLHGTSSWASDAISSSYALSASQAQNAVSSSYALSSSYSAFSATASNILGGAATYIPFFNTNTTLGPSTMFQVSNSFSTTSIAINETNITSDNPEALYVFQTHPTSINVLTGKGNLNHYLQNNIQNTNQGVSASSDVVATANNGNEDSNYIDMGINSQNYNAGFVGGANDAYLYSIANNLHIGNANDNGTHVGFFVGGTDVEANNKLQLNPNNQHIMSGSLDVSGSMSVNSGVTASLYGTASWANNSISSSYALTASYANNVPATASYALNAISSSYALTASYASNVPETSSYSLQALSSSYALTASYASNVPETASYSLQALSSSYALTASYANNVPATASYALNAISSSQAERAVSSSRPFDVYGSTIFSTQPRAGRPIISQIGAIGNVLIGYQAGYDQNPTSTLANSIAIGDNALYSVNTVGNNTTDNIAIGYSSGYATATKYGIMIGSYAGSYAYYAKESVMLGLESGRLSLNASSSIMIGTSAGSSISQNDSIGGNNIIIGTKVTLEKNRANSINIGGLIFGTGSYFAPLASASFSGSANGRIGINQPFPLFSLDVSGSGRYTNGLEVTGSLIAPNITGSLLGTASWASNAVNSITSSYILNAVSASFAATASQAVTASYVLNAVSASFATSASQAQNAISASYVLNAVSASYAATASTADDFTVRGTLTAQRIVVQTITSSTDFVTGSTRFGTLLANTHQFTGSVSITGSLIVIGAGITGSLFGTASWASNAISSSYSLSASQAQNAVSSSYPLRVTGSSIYSFDTDQVANVWTIAIGRLTGFQTTAAPFSTFLGVQAGFQAVSASRSVFIGDSSGYQSTNANSSFFAGSAAGAESPNANNSVFIGTTAGYKALNASGSVFLGYNAGEQAVNSAFSTIIGYNAGEFSHSSSFSTLIGYNVGLRIGASSGISSNNIIIGTNITLAAGRQDSINLGGLIFGTGSYSNINTNPFSGSANGRVGINQPLPGYSLDVSGSGNYSNGLTVTGSLIASFVTGSLLGTASWANNAISSSYALTASYANNVPATASYALQALSSSYPFQVTGSSILSYNTYNVDPNDSIYIGNTAGANVINTYGAIYLGYAAGYEASSSYVSNFIGYRAGDSSDGSEISNFIGLFAGYQASASYKSNFIGEEAGSQTLKAYNNNFIGYRAGYQVTNANNSNFIGFQTGRGAINSSYSNFIGVNAGLYALSASYSTIIGLLAGANFTGVGVGNNNIIVGNFITLEDNRKDSINIGGLIFGTGSYSGFSVFSGSANGRVGINQPLPIFSLDVSGSGRYTNGLQITGSLISSNITGSLLGTASNAVSSSYALSASQAQNAVSSSYAFTATTASHALVALQATSASYASTSSVAISSSYSQNSTSASFATTSSHTVNAEYSDRTVQIDVYVKNISGAQINKGKVVRINGAVGDNPLIVTASYEDDNNSANTLGITTQNIPNDGFGYVITEGILIGINTDTFTAGQLLYLGPTGSIIGTAPVAPLHGVRLGEVLRVQQNNGSMYVRIDNGYELGELHDIRDTTTSSSYGDLLIKSGSVWVNSKELYGSYQLLGSVSASSFTGSLSGNAATATTASFASNIATGLSISASSIYVSNNLNVAGTASFAYVQTVTGSAVIIGQEYIILNTQAPASRFAGLQIYDSGSAATASVVWDSLTDHFVYTKASGSSYNGGMFIAGPKNTGSLGQELGLTQYRIPVAQGDDHIMDSQIYSSGSITVVTGSLTATLGFTGSIEGTASWSRNSISASYALSASQAQSSVSASYVLNAVSSSYALSASQAVNAISTSYALTATSSSQAQNSVSASYVLNAISSSFSSTASYVLNAVSASFATSASQAQNSITASYVLNAISASFASTSSLSLRGITTASVAGSTITFTKGDSSTFNITIATATAETASYVSSSNVDGPYGKNSILSASYAVSASQAQNAVTASYILNAVSASYALNASQTQNAASSSYPFSVNGTTIYDTSAAKSNYSTTNGLFIGETAGTGATNADYSIFLGQSAGQTATNADHSVFLGRVAGYEATNANYSTIIGYGAGYAAANASGSIIIGPSAGFFATNAGYSVFLGTNAGNSATNAYFSNFIGYQAGLSTLNANYSTLIGYQAGYNASGVGISSNNIIIGTNITLTNGRQNSINIGGLLFGTGSYSTTTGNPFSGSANGRIGINQPLPLFSLDVSGSGRYTNGLTITGSLIASSITGSLQGTASWANNTISSSYALSASNAQTASYILNAVSASYATTASYAVSASQAQNAITASYVLNAVSASFASTASSADNFTVRGTLTAQTIVVQTITSSQDFVTGSTRFGTLLSNTHQFTGSISMTGSLNVVGAGITGSLFGTASWASNAISSSYALSASQAQNAVTASYVLNAISASFATSASQAQNAVTASYVLNAISSSFASTASYVLNAVSSSFATSASQAFNALTASYVLNAISSSYALSASQAQNAVTASYILNAVSASFAATASNVLGGAANYIPLWNGTTTLSSSVMYQSSSNVGIGTTSPIGSLEVYKSTTGGLGGHIVLSNNGLAVGNETALMFADGGAAGIRAAISSTTEGSPYYGDIKFKTGVSAYGSLSTRMIITGAGNVGIGTTSPNVKLEVAGLGRFTGTNGFSIGADAGQNRIQYSTSTFSRFALLSSGDAYAGLTAKELSIGATYGGTAPPSSGAIIEGNVGIGTTSPSQKLEVAGNISVTGVSGGNRYIIVGDATNTYTGTLVLQAGGGSSTWGGGVVLYGHSHATYPGSVYIGGSEGSSGPIIFGRGGIGPITELMRITSTGNVGIGTTSPNAKLDVNGNAIVTGSLTVTSTFTLDATLTDYATVASSVVGSNNLFTQATGSYTSAFFKYTVASGSSTRAGEVVAAWNGASVQFYDNSTLDIGTTTAVTSSVSIVTGNVQFNIQTNTSGWRIKSLATFI